MNQNQIITVKILDLPGAGGGCACSDLTRTPEYAAAVQQKIAELKTALAASFPGQAQVEYVDLRNHPDEMTREHGQLLAARKYPPPLVVVDGEAKFAGSILVAKIVKAVREALDAKPTEVL